ncbi:hypothetical protein [Carboxylicivirga sp. N1Y90]|uniref:hypothetical protein n=1 Tax=Carboxylicivirga fragile TaxID=3417571 RepID=UPI003D347CA4|nr:hypothetical protein [Marinilabiliaceae bacterium N1Y90]
MKFFSSLKPLLSRCLLIVCLFFVFLGILKAQSHNDHSVDTHHSNDAHHHQNHAALFVGGTSQYDLGKNITTLGIDYMRFFKKNPQWGISAATEIILADDIQWLIITPLVYQPFENFWLRSGPGFELVHNETHKIIGTFVMRFGLGYDINVDNLVISPSFDFDYIRYHPAVVWGVNIGMGF